MKRVTITILFFAISNFTFAEDFLIYGARSYGMGGTGTAYVTGAKSAHWNPARLAVTPSFDFSLSAVNLNVQVLGSAIRLVDEIKELPDLDELEKSYENGFDPLNPTHVTNARLAFKLLFSDVLEFKGDDGVLFTENTGLGVHFNVKKMSFGVSAGATVNIGVSAIADIDYSKITLGDDLGIKDSLEELFPNPVHTISDISSSNQASATSIRDLLLTSNIVTSNTDSKSLEEMLYQIDQAGVNLNDKDIQNSINEVVTATQPVQTGETTAVNLTLDEALKDAGVYARGIILTNFTLSGAYAINDKFAVGLNLNLYYARTFKRFFNIDDLDSYDVPTTLSEVEDVHKDDFEDSYNFGVDLGLNYTPLPGLSFGLVGKNLNQPTFSYKRGGDYKLYPQVRFGVAYQFKTKLLAGLIAADFDVLQNKTSAFPDTKWQQVGIGAELFFLKFLFARVGYNNNIQANEGKGGLYTAGIGFKIFRFRLDVSAGVGDDQIKVDGNSYPTRAGFALELQWSKTF